MNRPISPMDWMDEPAPDGVFVGTADDGLSLLGLPSATHRRNSGLGQERLREASDAHAVRARLAAVIEALGRAACTGETHTVLLDDLTSAERALMLDVLGQGEVSAQVALPDGALQASESVFPGLWILRRDGQKDAPWLEIGDVPACIREAVAAMPPRAMPLEVIVPPDGAMNVMSVLSEVRQVAQEWRFGDDNHILNFTLLPMTEPDVAFLAQMLGHGPVHIVSGGYGSARIIATAFAKVWAVQFLNSMGLVILDTLEIGDVPMAARAAPEDFQDSSTRLTTILQGALQ